MSIHQATPTFVNTVWIDVLFKMHTLSMLEDFFCGAMNRQLNKSRMQMFRFASVLLVHIYIHMWQACRVPKTLTGLELVLELSGTGFLKGRRKKKYQLGANQWKQMAWENVIPKENRTCSLGWFHSSRTPDEKRKHIVTRWNKQDFRVNRVEARAKISLLPLWVKLYLLPWCQIKLKQRKIDIFTRRHWTIEG